LTVPVYAGYEAHEVRRAIKRKEEPSYQGTFTSARRYVLHTFATTQSPLIKKRVSQYMIGSECSMCGGKRLRRESLSATGWTRAQKGRKNWRVANGYEQAL
jgi:excinuclease ABC subunit A